MKGEIELGDLAKDSVSGFKGVVVGVTKWLSGCDRYVLQPQELQENGAPVEIQSFDVTQLVLIKKAVVPVVLNLNTERAVTGGPRPTPRRW